MVALPANHFGMSSMQPSLLCIILTQIFADASSAFKSLSLFNHHHLLLTTTAISVLILSPGCLTQGTRYVRPHHLSALCLICPAMTNSLSMPGGSPIRRKPQYTYRSPSASTPENSFQRLSSSQRSGMNSQKVKSPPSSSKPPQVKNAVTSSISLRQRYPMNPPLPLYHPLGQLALSLPPLDTAAFGLPPIPSSVFNDGDSSRSRKSMSQGRDGEDELESPPASAISPLTPVAVPARETKPSPRKRRAGGGGQRRKRKEPDDSDAPYPNPPKRTRHPRSGGRFASATADVASPTESTSGLDLGDVTPTPQAKPDLPDEDIVPERRSTRSRNMPKRRDSSDSAVTTPIDQAPSEMLTEATVDGDNGNKMAVDAEVSRDEAEPQETPQQPADDGTKTKDE